MSRIGRALVLVPRLLRFLQLASNFGLDLIQVWWHALVKLLAPFLAGSRRTQEVQLIGHCDLSPLFEVLYSFLLLDTFVHDLQMLIEVLGVALFYDTLLHIRARVAVSSFIICEAVKLRLGDPSITLEIQSR